MIVTLDNFAVIYRELKEGRRLAVDTETSSLRPYSGGTPFSLVIASSAQKAFYFNFNIAPDIPKEAQLERYHADLLGKLLCNPKNYLFLHNAKFDMAMLKNIGIELDGMIHDTMVVERLIRNDARSLALAACAERIGYKKDPRVEEYIAEHKLYTISYRGKREIKDLQYYKVPFPLISEYAEMDAKITFALGEKQLEEIAELDGSHKNFRLLVKNELALLKTVFAMEQHGVLIDREYCDQAREHEDLLMADNANQFKSMTGKDFIDSPGLFLEIFKDEKITYGEATKTGQRNPRFDNYALEAFESPLAKHVLEYRAAKKRHDFYEGFTYFADADNILHAGFNQAGTQTGRFSGWEPNLQQLKKDEGEDLNQKFVVRRALIPRPGFMFLMLDYQQVEYKLMLDMANAMGLISKIKDGLDVHQATADLAGISRKDAKEINFAILYGAGAAKIAKSLGVSEDEARKLKQTVLNASPEIRRFIYDIMGKAKRSGVLYNWFFRKYTYPDPNFAYRGPNHIIQGGSADVMKIAMNRIHEYLKDRKSKMVMTIHDEIVVELHETEKYIVPKLKKIMETVYPARHLPLTCTVEYSRKNLADKQKLDFGLELETETKFEQVPTVESP